MLRDRLSRSGWQGICLVAITYAYFLIFAQFAFLKRLGSLGIADTHLKLVMGAMAAGGIGISLLAPRIRYKQAPGLRLRISFIAAAFAALLSVTQLNIAGAAFTSLLIGSGLGLLTVTLVAHLREWVGTSNPMLIVGAGTGLGYFVCNYPAFFNARPETQAIAAGGLCIAGTVITLCRPSAPAEFGKPEQNSGLSISRALPAFAALVWLDSAAFFIIQNTSLLKAHTWQGDTHLWSNAFLHLGAACVSAWLLTRRRFTLVLLLAFLSLGSACLLLSIPGSMVLASILYPIGVSLYSVALVAYPSFIAYARTADERGRIAGWIYAVAGWIGSAMGIGMGQNLGHVPTAFVCVSGAAVLLPQVTGSWKTRRREMALTTLVLAAGYMISRFIGPDLTSAQLSQVERGRQIYISEGCIHCHSQYVRPASADVLMWGPTASIAEIRNERPPLIGNRRQGPDLSQVGVRRSALWLKMHFVNPAEVSGASVMPSYAFLFRDQRGDDLVAYLASLHAAGTDLQLTEQSRWQPSPDSLARASTVRGEQLYNRDCATCHSAMGRTRTTWRNGFKELPIEFPSAHLLHLSLSDSPTERLTQLARVVKFGIAGTDMAGHEYLSDNDISSIAIWLSRHITQQNERH